jgi:hypothetical protein
MDLAFEIEKGKFRGEKVKILSIKKTTSKNSKTYYFEKQHQELCKNSELVILKVKNKVKKNDFKRTANIHIHLDSFDSKYYYDASSDKFIVEKKVLNDKSLEMMKELEKLKKKLNFNYKKDSFYKFKIKFINLYKNLSDKLMKIELIIQFVMPTHKDQFKEYLYSHRFNDLFEFFTSFYSRKKEEERLQSTESISNVGSLEEWLNKKFDEIKKQKCSIIEKIP